jgi:hypothetical protein
MNSKLIIALFCLLAYNPGVNAQKKDLSDLKTFGTIGKETKNLTKDKEVVLLEHKGKGAMTHAWFGADYKAYGQTRIRYYIDGETVPSIDMDLLMGHGIGFNDNSAPWTVTKMGKTGSPSGIYNTFRIPFGKEIKITAQLAPDSPDHPNFWYILRGTENLPVTLGGVKLPDKARLKLHKLEDQEFDPMTEFDMCNVGGKGALFLVTIAAKGLRTYPDEKKRHYDISYLEACIRAYLNGSSEPTLLSSGLEDYFLGTYYFNRGKYYSDIAGLTHFDKNTAEFSAFRFHDEDPVFFQTGFRLTNRVGEEVDNHIIFEPPRTRYTTYVWLYQW